MRSAASLASAATSASFIAASANAKACGELIRGHQGQNGLLLFRLLGEAHRLGKQADGLGHRTVIRQPDQPDVAAQR